MAFLGSIEPPVREFLIINQYISLPYFTVILEIIGYWFFGSKIFPFQWRRMPTKG